VEGLALTTAILLLVVQLHDRWLGVLGDQRF
jgi:hypothetical protein